MRGLKQKISRLYDGGLDPIDIAETLGISETVVSRILAELEAEEYIDDESNS